MTIEEILEKHGITYPSCGAYVGDGWLLIVDLLVTDLVAMGWDKDLHQIKEKFGGLRFYVGEATQEMYDRIGVAEEEAARTCEECGAPGEIRRVGSWLLACRCGEHHDRMAAETVGRYPIPDALVIKKP